MIRICISCAVVMFSLVCPSLTAIAGEVDLLPCVGITKQRQELFLFTDVYLTYQRVLLSRVDGPTYSLDELEELDDIKIGVQKNSSHHSYIVSELDITPVVYKDNEELLVALSFEERVIANTVRSEYLCSLASWLRVSRPSWLGLDSTSKK